MNNQPEGEIVIPFLQGGFVNQLLQIVSVYGLCKSYNRQFGINLKHKAHNPHSNIDYYNEENGFFKNLVTKYKTNVEPQVTFCEDGKFKINDWKGWLNSTKHQKVIIKGYLQSAKWFSHCKDELFQMFYWGTPQHLHELNVKYPHLATSYFIHFRLGDYLTLAFHKIDLTKYYAKCIDLFNAQNPNPGHVYLFSNEANKVESMFQQSVLSKLNCSSYTIIRDENEIDCLYLMSQCGQGGIAANSSYSWFGLYLNTNRPLLCLPDKWFNDNSMQIDGFYFEGATRVSIQ